LGENTAKAIGIVYVLKNYVSGKVGCNGDKYDYTKRAFPSNTATDCKHNYLCKGLSLSNLTVNSVTAEALVQAQLVAYNQHDLASFVALFSDDVCIYRPPATEPVIRGKAAFSDFYQNERFNLPYLHAEILNRMVVGNKVVDHERICGIRNEPFEVMVVFEVVDGLIQNMWSFATS